MGFVDISVRLDMKAAIRDLQNIADKQIAFATATTLNRLAREVQAAETKAIEQTFDRPTPFTVKAVRVRGARKNMPEAIVYMGDVTASYLEPYEFGGRHKLNGKAVLNPKDVQTNAYGNLPRNLLAKLKARSDVFIGAVKTRNGDTINGVWQRSTPEAPTAGKRAKRGANTSGHLKLLIRFGDALPVKQRLHYVDRATKIVNAKFTAYFGEELAKAMATAR